MVEAVQAKLASGYESVYRATIEAMREFKSALITTSVVFMAVFIPSQLYQWHEWRLLQGVGTDDGGSCGALLAECHHIVSGTM